jgi:apolipoprotein D and lipocalin family protein
MVGGSPLFLKELNSVIVKLRLVLLGVLLFLSGCTGLPQGVTAVDNFDLSRYLGQWYEIARLDHSFERGLTDISASYSLRDDGGVRVINRGYDVEEGAWQEAEGKAYFVAEPTTGMLKVSFFGPFYGGYNVIALDQEGYQYALVSGPDRGYLWFLARTPSIPQDVREKLLAIAENYGFATQSLIWVTHEKHAATESARE